MRSPATVRKGAVQRIIRPGPRASLKASRKRVSLDPYDDFLDEGALIVHYHGNERPPCVAKIKNYETRKTALRHKGLLLFLTPSALSATVSEYHAVANGRDTPDRGHDGSHFGDRSTAGMGHERHATSWFNPETFQTVLAALHIGVFRQRAPKVGDGFLAPPERLEDAAARIERRRIIRTQLK